MHSALVSRVPFAINRSHSVFQKSRLSISTLNRGNSQKIDATKYLGLHHLIPVQESLVIFPSIVITPSSQRYQQQTIKSIQTSNRYFSSSDSSTRGSRRRRAGSGNTREVDNEEDRSSVNAPSPSSIVKDEDIFLGTVRAFLDKVEEAVMPMKAHNEVFKVKRDSNETGNNLTITLKPGEGQYIFQVDDEMKSLTLNSPMSGTYTYVLCAYTGNFVGMNDGHLCEGILVRDMIRHCNGLPKF